MTPTPAVNYGAKDNAVVSVLEGEPVDGANLVELYRIILYMLLAETPVKCEVAFAAFRAFLEPHRYCVVVDGLPFLNLVSTGKTSIYEQPVFFIHNASLQFMRTTFECRSCGKP